MKRTTHLLLVAALSIVSLSACKNDSSSSSTGGKQEGKVIAEVNGSSITTGDFDHEVKNLPDYLKAMADTPNGRKEMLETMVVRELIMADAKKNGIDKDPKIEERLADLKKRLIVELYLNKKLEAASQMSDADLKAFYEQNKERFKTGEQIKASHILVKTEKEAQDVLNQLKSGAKFEDVAKKSSVDSSAAKGGDLGWFGAGNMVPAFEKAAMALKEGETSGIVKSDFGFHIIKLTGKRPAGIRPFEEVKEQIKAAVMPSKQQEVFQKVKEELRKGAKVTIKDESFNPPAEAAPAANGAAPMPPNHPPIGEKK